MHGQRACPYKSAYVSAKHGLEGLSKVIALEGARKGSPATVYPGYVRTPLVEEQVADQARTRGIDPDAVLDQVLLARPRSSAWSSPPRSPSWSRSCAARHRLDHRHRLLIDGGWTAP